MRIYLPKKVVFTEAKTVLLYDFSTMNEHFLLKVMFSLKTVSQVLATVIKIF